MGGENLNNVDLFGGNSLSDGTVNSSSGYNGPGTFITSMNDTKFLVAKATMGNFECRENVKDIEKYGILSFGFDKSAAEEWGRKNFKDWMKKNKNIKPEIEYYTGTGSDDIRNYIDGTGLYSKNVKKIEENIHKSLQEAHLPEDVLLYRVISKRSLEKMIAKSGYDGKIATGMLIKDNSYMSTSLVANNSYNKTSKKGIILRIAAQKGQHAAYINEWSSVKKDDYNEYEVLVDKNSYIYIRDFYYVPRKSIIGECRSEDVVLVVEGELLQK